MAGNRTGLDGSQSSLFFEYIRIVKEMREATNNEKPRFMVWENVPGAFSSNKGQDFRAVLENIAQIKDSRASIPMPDKWEWAGTILGEGWSIAWRVLDAQYWGVPQRRQRIFLIADFDGESAGEILFDSESVFRDSSADFRTWEKASGNDGSGSEETGRYLIENHSQDSRYKFVDTCPTLSAKMGTGGNNVPLTLKIRQGCAGGGKGALISKDMTGTLSTHNDITLFEPVYIAGKSDFFTVANENVSGALLAADSKQAPVVSYPDETKTYDVEEDTTTYIVRRITPTECGRLQGFPDWWCDDLEIEDPTEEDMVFWRQVFDTWCEVNGKKKKTDNQIRKWLKTESTDTAKYKMWGNGVALPCVDYVMCGLAHKLDTQ